MIKKQITLNLPQPFPTVQIQKYQIELTEPKNTPERFNSRLDEAEEKISQLEDKAVELIQSEQQKEKRMKKREDCLRGNIKQSNIRIRGVPEGEVRKKGS